MSRKFVKVYRDLANEYPTIYDDAETLGTYVQLLMDADALWPTRPQVPRRVKDGPLRRLIDSGLVTQEQHGRYSIKGLDRMREAQSEAQRDRVIGGRWAKKYPGRYPDTNADTAGNAERYLPDQTRQDQTTPSARARDGSKNRGGNGTSPYLRVDTGGLEPLTRPLASMPSFEEMIRSGRETSNSSEGTASVEVKP